MNGTRTLGERLTRTKPVAMLVGDTAGADSEHGHLKRGITPFQLTMFGVGSTIGTGIFFVLAQTVPPPVRRSSSPSSLPASSPVSRRSATPKWPR